MEVEQIEELPSDEMADVIEVDVPETMEVRLRVIADAIESLKDSAAFTNLSEKIDTVGVKVDSAIEAARQRKPYDLDYLIEEMRTSLGDMRQSVETFATTATRKIDSATRDLHVRADALTETLASAAATDTSLTETAETIRATTRQLTDALADARQAERTAAARMSELERLASSLASLRGAFGAGQKETAAAVARLGDKIDDQLATLKESSIKLSLLTDTIEQKVVELSSVFDALGTIETSLASQTDSLRTAAGAMKTFLEETKKIPDQETLAAAVADATAAHLERAATHANDRLTDTLDRSVERLTERMGDVEQRLGRVVRDAIEESGATDASRQIAVTLGELRSRIDDLEAAIRASAADGNTENVRAELEETANAVRNAMTMIDDVRSRIDEIAVALRSLPADQPNGVRAELEATNARIEQAVRSIDTATEEAARNSDDLRTTIAALRSSQNAVAELPETVKAMDASLQKTVSAFDRKTDDLLNLTYSKLNALSDLAASLERSVAALEKVRPAPQPRAPRAQRRAARPKTRTRVVRIRAARPTRRRVDDEAVDVMIMNALTKTNMDMATLERTTGVGEKRLRARLKLLIARGVVRRERVGRAVIYAIVQNT